MLRALFVGLTLATPVAADEWVVLDGPTLEAVLNDTTLQYERARQVFYKSGRTLYDAGRPSWGNWAARGDKYCSEWPPASGWNCYRVERHSSDTMIRFVSETGHVTDGKIVE